MMFFSGWMFEHWFEDERNQIEKWSMQHKFDKVTIGQHFVVLADPVYDRQEPYFFFM